MIKMINKLLRRKPDFHYVSGIDKFLADYNKKHPELSDSQKQEAQKYRRVFNLRDNVVKKDKKANIWQSF